jgi:hypothetical protein
MVQREVTVRVEITKIFMVIDWLRTRRLPQKDRSHRVGFLVDLIGRAEDIARLSKIVKWHCKTRGAKH